MLHFLSWLVCCFRDRESRDKENKEYWNKNQKRKVKERFDVGKWKVVARSLSCPSTGPSCCANPNSSPGEVQRSHSPSFPCPMGTPLTGWITNPISGSGKETKHPNVSHAPFPPRVSRWPSSCILSLLSVNHHHIHHQGPSQSHR